MSGVIFFWRSQVLGRGMLVFFTIFSISGLIVMKLLWAIEDDVRILKSYRLWGLPLTVFHKLSRAFILFWTVRTVHKKEKVFLLKSWSIQVTAGKHFGVRLSINLWRCYFSIKNNSAKNCPPCKESSGKWIWDWNPFLYQPRYWRK